jgi:tripartite-type tricarboxylate transporter receptor subunit TctC
MYSLELSTERKFSSKRLLVAFAAMSLSVFVALASAQDSSYPSRPITIIVPYSAGGGNDDVARILAPRVSQNIGQPVLVENRPGASGMIAGLYVSRSAPNGYTIMDDFTGIVINPWLYSKVLFDVRKDLAPITLAVTLGSNLLVHPSLPVHNVKDLIALAKAQPGKLSYSSPGIGSPMHIEMEIFKKRAGVDIVHVPYKGGAPATMAILANEVQVIFSGTTGLPHVQAGKLRAIATTGLTRSSLLPDVPTVAESGLEGYSSVSWMGFFAPAKTPASIISRLNAEFVKALKMPDVTKQFEAGNMSVVGSTPEAFRKTIEEDFLRYGKIIQELGIKKMD